MVRYICQYCHKILDTDETLIDVDGPLCEDCYNKQYEPEQYEPETETLEMKAGLKKR